MNVAQQQVNGGGVVGGGGNGKTSTPTIVFNASKNELFQLADNYKTMHRKLKLAWRVEV